MSQLIIRFSGDSSSPAFSIKSNAEDMKISVRDGGTNEVVIFTGDAFSQEQFEAKGGKKAEKLFFDTE